MKMSPASSKSKAKDKKGSKEAQNSSVKLTVSGNMGNGVATNAYNPSLGTFHTLESMPDNNISNHNTPPSLQPNNGRFRGIYDSDEHSGAPSPNPEYDSGSWSGESEDPREKPPNPCGSFRQDTIPGAGENEKREKIRQKNERKHLRQKERRAHELHERCCGYVMSRKLEGLAQKLVAMGFSSERATMALILNEGKLEESVTWLFEGHGDGGGGDGNRSNLKLDISKELVRIDEMQIRYGCSKQEVERVIVSCEGDLRKASESLRAHKPEKQSPRENNGDGDARVSGPPPTSHTFKRDEGNLGKPPASGEAVERNGAAAVAAGDSKKMIQSRLDLARPTGPEKRWMNPVVSTGNSFGSVETRTQVHVQEPVIMMQRPKSVPSTATISSVDMMKNNNSNHNGGTRSPSPNMKHQQQLYVQNQQQPFNPIGPGWTGGGSSIAVAPASSLGLFSGLSISGPSSSPPVDWSTGSSTGNFDYSSIDWSLDRGPKPNGVWRGSDNNPGFGGSVGYSGGSGRTQGEGSSTAGLEGQGGDVLSLPRHFIPSPYR